MVLITYFNVYQCDLSKKKILLETSTPTRPVENVVLMTKGLQERNTQLLDVAMLGK